MIIKELSKEYTKIEKKKELSELLENWDPDRVIIFCDEDRNGKNEERNGIRSNIYWNR